MRRRRQRRPRETPRVGTVMVVGGAGAGRCQGLLFLLFRLLPQISGCAAARAQSPPAPPCLRCPAAEFKVAAPPPPLPPPAAQPTRVQPPRKERAQRIKVGWVGRLAALGRQLARRRGAAHQLFCLPAATAVAALAASFPHLAHPPCCFALPSCHRPISAGGGGLPGGQRFRRHQRERERGGGGQRGRVEAAGRHAPQERRRARQPSRQPEQDAQPGIRPEAKTALLGASRSAERAQAIGHCFCFLLADTDLTDLYELTF